MQMVNLLTKIELQLRVNSKDQTISVFNKKIFKRSHLFFKTRFKIFILMADIGQVCRLAVFRDLDLPPFQSNIGVAVVGTGEVTSLSS